MGMKNISARDNFIAIGAPVLQRLESAGFEAYLVGGCVREALRAEHAEESHAKTADLRDPQQTDIDITTNALPEEICRIFSDLPVIETGIKHGTVTVLLPGLREPAPENNQPGEPIPPAPIPIEITTYRVDGAYSDGRHPDEVRFVTSLTEDLRRRDFTVNAMAMDLRGRIDDPFGGQEDLAAGIIRAVGDPEKRFREDGLRILRALRFAAVLTAPTSGDSAVTAPTSGDSAVTAPTTTAPATTVPAGYRIEPATEAALFACKDLLQGISAERIFVELKKLVCGRAAGDVVRKYADILAVVIPELAPMKGFAQNNPYHKYDVLEHCIRAMEVVQAPETAAPKTAAPETAAPETAAPQTAAPQTTPEASSEAGRQTPAPQSLMKLAALLHDVGKPSTYFEDEKGIGHFYGHPQEGAKIVKRIMHRLKADRFTADRIETLVHYHDLVFQEDDRLLKRWMNRYTPEVLLEILAIKRADNIATGNVSQELLDKFDRIEARIKKIREDAEKGETCFCMRDLAVGGRDLMEAGIPEGPEIGRALQELLEQVIDGKVPNEKERLLEALHSRR